MNIWVVQKSIDKPELEKFEIVDVYLFSTKEKAVDFLNQEYLEFQKAHDFSMKIYNETKAKMDLLSKDFVNNDRLWFYKQRLEIFSSTLTYENNCLRYEEGTASLIGEHTITEYFAYEQDLDTKDSLL